MDKKREVDRVMGVELLADLENRTGREGPFQANYEEDRATCQAIIEWMGGDRYTWERLRLLLNYVHDRGVRLGAERARAVIMGNVLGGAVYREFTLWGRGLTGLDMEELQSFYNWEVGRGFEHGLAGSLPTPEDLDPESGGDHDGS